MEELKLILEALNVAGDSAENVFYCWTAFKCFDSVLGTFSFVVFCYAAYRTTKKVVEEANKD